jgi:hypothetical protein
MADWRWAIEKKVRQLLPLSIINRQSKTVNRKEEPAGLG